MWQVAVFPTHHVTPGWPQFTVNTRFSNRFPVPFNSKYTLPSPVLFQCLYQASSHQAFQFNPTRSYVGGNVIIRDVREAGTRAPPQGPHNHRSVELGKAMRLSPDHSTPHKPCRGDLALPTQLWNKYPYFELIIGLLHFPGRCICHIPMTYSWHQSPSPTVGSFSSGLWVFFLKWYISYFQRISIFS